MKAPHTYGLIGKDENSDVLSHKIEQNIRSPAAPMVHTNAPASCGSSAGQPRGGGGPIVDGSSVTSDSDPGQLHCLTATCVYNESQN